jgi:hypothetical protein
VLYNSARTRDLSHYESFATYHRSLYRQVEATGATPFAARARDRGLHGVLVAIARLLVDGATGDSSAGGIDRWADDLRSRAQLLVTRAQSIDDSEVPALEKEIEKLITAWEEADGLRKYAGWMDSTNALLTPAGGSGLQEPLEFPVEDPPWSTLTSLRDVDTETALRLVKEKVRTGGK